ncbi:MAG: sigma-70 family RNA polymerase sigma factor [Bacteroidales bacterium]
MKPVNIFVRLRNDMDYRGDIYYIQKVYQGDRNAYSFLVDRHKDRAYNLALRISGNREDAEEITQDAFLKAFRSLGSFKMKSAFATWVYRIVYNTAISFVRARKKGVLSIEDFPADALDFIGFSSNIREAENDYRSSLVNFALQKIEAEERALITLYYYEEMSTDKISEVTGISRSNVKVRLFRARQKMIRIICKVEHKNIVYDEQAGS